MIKIIGFEGALPNSAPITWGAAAILVDDGRVINARTRREINISQYDALVAEGHAVKFARAIDLEDDWENHPLTVAIVNSLHDCDRILHTNTGALGGYLKSLKFAEFNGYIFDSPRAFDQYAHKCIDRILSNATGDDISDDESLKLLNVGMSLDSSHPDLNAIWAIKQDGEIFRRLARANLLNEADRNKFDSLLEAFDHIHEDYQFKYTDGVAEGGGLDIDVAINTLTSLRTITTSIRPKLAEAHPFLNEKFQPARLHELKAASATLIFSADLEKRSLGERLARAIERREIQKVLAGESSPGRQEPKFSDFQEALKTILSPSDDTKVSHRPVGKAEDEAITYVPDQHSSISESTQIMRLLGFQSGLVNKAHNMEIMLSPSLKLRISSIDDGRNSRPLGVDYLFQSSDFLFRPAVFSVSHSMNEKGTQRFHLHEVKLLGEGEKVYVTAIPSVVTKFAFYATRLPIHISAREKIQIGTDHELRFDASSLPSAEQWLSQYFDVCRRIEAAAESRPASHWIAPLRPVKLSSLHRILLVLAEHGGTLNVRTLVEEIDQRFNVRVLRNNTRREQILNPDLLQFSDDTRRVVQWTALGKGYAYALTRIIERCGRV